MKAKKTERGSDYSILTKNPDLNAVFKHLTRMNQYFFYYSQYFPDTQYSVQYLPLVQISETSAAAPCGGRVGETYGIKILGRVTPRFIPTVFMCAYVQAQIYIYVFGISVL